MRVMEIQAYFLAFMVLCSWTMTLPSPSPLRTGGWRRIETVLPEHVDVLPQGAARLRVPRGVALLQPAPGRIRNARWGVARHPNLRPVYEQLVRLPSSPLSSAAPQLQMPCSRGVGFDTDLDLTPQHFPTSATLLLTKTYGDPVWKDSPIAVTHICLNINKHRGEARGKKTRPLMSSSVSGTPRPCAPIPYVRSRRYSRTRRSRATTAASPRRARAR